MIDHIDQLIDELIAREGDFVDHPADNGGPTRWGITQAVARRHGYTGEMHMLPRHTAAAMYKRVYWHAPAFDQLERLAPKLAAEMFDTGVNMGTGTAIGFLQRALNALNRNSRDYPDISIDRKIGPETLRAVQAFLRCRGPRRTCPDKGDRCVARRLLCPLGRIPPRTRSVFIRLVRKPNWLRTSKEGMYHVTPRRHNWADRKPDR